jgi:4-hydroxy-tetrahydrodipicolinate synthase
MPITKLIFSENNPAGIKAVLSGLNISNPHVRLPLVEATNQLKDEILIELRNLGKS